MKRPIKNDKKQWILKQVPMSASEIRELEKAMKPVDASIFMVKPKTTA